LEALQLGRLELGDLDVDFTEEEIWIVVTNLPPDKTQGPDGFSVSFFQACWQLINQGGFYGGNHATDKSRWYKFPLVEPCEGDRSRKQKISYRR
jgi:hypothetical protein